MALAATEAAFLKSFGAGDCVLGAVWVVECIGAAALLLVAKLPSSYGGRLHSLCSLPPYDDGSLPSSAAFDGMCWVISCHVTYWAPWPQP